MDFDPRDHDPRDTGSRDNHNPRDAFMRDLVRDVLVVRQGVAERQKYFQAVSYHSMV